MHYFCKKNNYYSADKKVAALFFLIQIILFTAAQPASSQTYKQESQRIFKSNVNEFTENLPADIAALVSSGELEFSKANFVLKSKGKASEFTKFPKVSLEANQARIPKEKPSNSMEDSNPEEDEANLAFKNFLNTKSDKITNSKEVLFQLYKEAYSRPLTRLTFNLKNLKDNSLIFEAKGQIARLFPKAFDFNEPSVQIFREKIQINQPQIMQGYSFLRYIFSTEDETAAWLYSPLLKKARVLSGSSQSDNFLLSNLAFDSFWEWLPILSQTELLDIQEELILANFIDSPEKTLAKLPESCFAASDATSSNWNIDNQALVGAAGQIHTSSSLHLRPALRIDLQINNPYLKTRKVTLYVDSEYGKVLYRSTYDNSGQSIITEIYFNEIYLTSDKNGLVSKPILRSKMVYNHESNIYSLLDYSQINYCLADRNSKGESTRPLDYYLKGYRESEVGEVL